LARLLLRGDPRARVDVPAGPVALDQLGLPDDAWGLILCEGSMLKAVVVEHEERALTELLIPGDVLLPWPPAVDGLPAHMRLTALEPVKLAVLGERVVQIAARRPALMIELQGRLAQQEHRVAVHGVICQLPRVEDRIVAVLRHFAARVGRVCSDGTRVPVELTHEDLGNLIGARRPTVSLALTRLRSLVSRLDDGTFLLRPAVPNDPREAFDPTPHLDSHVRSAA
jgi:CRP-like cAMP-binding protein